MKLSRNVKPETKKGEIASDAKILPCPLRKAVTWNFGQCAVAGPAASASDLIAAVPDDRDRRLRARASAHAARKSVAAAGEERGPSLVVHAEDTGNGHSLHG